MLTMIMVTVMMGYKYNEHFLLHNDNENYIIFWSNSNGNEPNVITPTPVHIL